MLTFDPKSKSISKKISLRKSNHKGKLSGVKFSQNHNISPLNDTQINDINGIVDLSPMLFMQEVNYDSKNATEENKKLQELGKNAIKHLKLLQLALTNDNLQESHLRNLQNLITTQDLRFASKEHRQLASEIITRIAVEIAKLEMAKIE